MQLNHFKKTLIYDRTADISSLRADLDQIEEFDKSIEFSIKILRCLQLAGLLLVGVGIGFKLGTWIVVIGAILAIAGVVIHAFRDRLDLEDARYEIVDAVLGMLVVDSAPDSQVHVRIDFRAPDHESKFLRDGRSGAWKVEYYADPCISIQGRLLDGVRYSAVVTQKVQNRSKQKRSASGKVKHKTKIKAGAELQLSLKFKPEKLDAMQQIAGRIEGGLKVPDGQQIKSFQAGENQLVLQLKSVTPAASQEMNGHKTIEALASMFLGLYQGFNVARDIQKAGSRA